MPVLGFPPSTSFALAGEAYQHARETSQQSRRDKFSSDPGEYEDYRRKQEQRQITLVRAIEAQDYTPWVSPAERMLRNRGFTVDLDAHWFDDFVKMVAEATVASAKALRSN